jgi:hypothetical protein
MMERAMRRVVDKLLHADGAGQELAVPGRRRRGGALRCCSTSTPPSSAVTLADTDPGAASLKPDSASGTARTQEDT